MCLGEVGGNPGGPGMSASEIGMSDLAVGERGLSFHLPFCFPGK